MAYNYNTYNPYLNYPSYGYAPPQQPIAQQPAQQTTRSLLPAASEDYARNYPLAPGNSALFYDINQPNIYYEKAAGLSSMDPPSFKRLMLVEDTAEIKESKPEYITRSEYDELLQTVTVLKKSVLDLINKGDNDE